MSRFIRSAATLTLGAATLASLPAMAADDRMERVMSDRLHDWLDPVAGPHSLRASYVHVCPDYPYRQTTVTCNRQSRPRAPGHGNELDQDLHLLAADRRERVS